ncbi:hypothetical protein ABDK56_10040 [Sphingomonas sp. ASV193]|uniref:membrane protein YczE n=1 Tax=Sphingomonas sp. ASV193 TaxID=3144405 RepID=UPI0032E9292A
MQHARNLSQLVAGLLLYGLASALMVRAGLGLAPWSVLHQGLSQTLGITFGTATLATGAVILLTWIPLRQRVGLGTIANVLVIGPAADLSLWLLPVESHFALRLMGMLAGIFLTGLASGIYIGAGYEPGPRDGLATGIARKTRFEVRTVRTALELSVLLVGMLLGGTVGVGTLAFALMIGPLFQRSLARFAYSFSQR